MTEHELLLSLHRDMLRVRMVEEAIAERYAEQEMRCPVHLSIGQEAAAIGVCRALRRTDKVFSTHRCHSHYLAKGGDLKRMLAEIYGKAAGCQGGRGGSMHLSDPAVGMMLSVPIVGSSIPLAVGSALADRRSGRDHVSVVFVGDASLEEGVFHESANFASLHKLPVVFACENNLYSVYTHVRDRQPDRPLSDLARAHGLAIHEADGNDVDAVYRTASRAIEAARRGEGPGFLLLPTYRWREHCGPAYDDHLGYRAKGELDGWKDRCPLERSRRRLQALGLLDSGHEAKFTTEIAAEIDDAFRVAKAAPLPEASEAASHVYA